MKDPHPSIRTYNTAREAETESKIRRRQLRRRIKWAVTCDCGNRITVGGKFEVDCVNCGIVYTLIRHEKDQTIM